jgi:DNA-binding SARP family transcriptional activator
VGLEVNLLGEPELRFDGRAWNLQAPRITWSLIALLVLNPRPLERAGLGCLLWPDREDEVARSTLRRYLHRLTNALPPGEWILTTAKTLAWNRDAGSVVDVLEFERAIAENRLEAAVERYAGDLLGATFDEAILQERERLRTAYLDAIERLASQACAQRNFAVAVRYAEQLLAADEWREDAVRAVMSARYQDGDRSGALAAYDRFARALHQELRVQPMAETTALRDAILKGVVIAEEVAPAPRARDTSVPFVGRTSELRALQNAWARVARGRGSTAFLAGEAGIGKSRLAQELSIVVEEQGGRVLHGRTSSPEAGAFEAVVEALREGLPFVGRGDLDDVWWASLAAVMPEIASIHSDLAPAAALEPEAARLRQREAFARLVAATSARRPLAIVLEDLHWAHAETIELIESLSRRVVGLPIFLVLTMRAEEVGAAHPLESMRRRLQQERRGQTIALGRLGETDIRGLAKALLTPDLADDAACARILDMASGHPLFAVQLLRYYLDTGEMPAERRPPETVGEAVSRRMQRLSEEARTTAGIAATIEGAFTVEELARISGWEESRILDAVGTLLDAKLIGERGGERFAYGFTHALIESAVRESVPAGDRRARHRRIAAVLEETRAGDAFSAALIAAHWESAGESHRAALARLQAAKVSMDRYARRDAIAHARQALELGLDAGDRFSALSLVAVATQELGEFSAGFPEIDALESLALELGPERQFEALMVRLRAARFDPETHRRAAERLDVLATESGRDDWRLEADFARAWTLAVNGDYENAERTVRSILERARLASNDALTFRALEPFLQLIVRRGKIDEALAEIAALESELERSGDKRALAPLTQGYLEITFSTEFADAALCAKARAFAMRLAEEGGDVHVQLGARTDLAYGAQVAWDVALARSEFRECARLGEELGLTQLQAIALSNLGGLETDIGHPERGLEYLKESATIAKRTKFSPLACATSIGAVDANLALGRIADAKREADAALAAAPAIGQPKLLAGALVAAGAVMLCDAMPQAGPNPSAAASRSSARPVRRGRSQTR